MMETAFHSMPRPRDVLQEQVRAIGYGLRRPAIVALALTAVATVLILTDFREVTGFHPEQQMIPRVLGLLLPISVWRGDARFGAGFMWTLPVDRRRHALAKVFGGWLWLMVIVAIFIIWQLVVTLVSGGNILGVETIRLIPFPVPETGSIDPALLQTISRTPQPLFWLVPFTGATVMYLLASAVGLGFRRPVRWIVGAVLVVLLMGLILERTNAQWLRMAPSRIASFVVYGKYGLDTLVSARTETLQATVSLTTGERVTVWLGLPDRGHWAIATLLWTGVSLAALWAAVSRHRETRRR